MSIMNKDRAIQMLERMQDPEPYEPQITSEAFDALQMAIEALKYSEVPNSSDTISRQAAIDALDEQIEQCDKSLSSFDISMKDEYAVKVERASLVAFREILEYLLPAQPNRGKWGKWEMGIDERFVKCSECGMITTRNELRGLAVFGKNEPNFCPNCGADMRGEQDEP